MSFKEAEKNTQDTRRLEPAEAFTLTMLGAIFGVPIGAMGAGIAFAVRHALQQPTKAVKPVEAVKALEATLEPVCQAWLEPITKPIAMEGTSVQLFKSRKTAETFFKVVSQTRLATVGLVNPRPGEALIQIISKAEVASPNLPHKLWGDLARNWSWPLFILIILVGVMVAVQSSAWAVKSSMRDTNAVAKEDTAGEDGAVVKEDSMAKGDGPVDKGATAEEDALAKAKDSAVATTKGRFGEAVEHMVIALVVVAVGASWDKLRLG